MTTMSYDLPCLYVLANSRDFNLDEVAKRSFTQWVVLHSRRYQPSDSIDDLGGAHFWLAVALAISLTTVEPFVAGLTVSRAMPVAEADQRVLAIAKGRDLPLMVRTACPR